MNNPENKSFEESKKLHVVPQLVSTTNMFAVQQNKLSFGEQTRRRLPDAQTYEEGENVPRVLKQKPNVKMCIIILGHTAQLRFDWMAHSLGGGKSGVPRGGEAVTLADLQGLHHHQLEGVWTSTLHDGESFRSGTDALPQVDGVQGCLYTATATRFHLQHREFCWRYASQAHECYLASRIENLLGLPLNVVVEVSWLDTREMGRGNTCKYYNKILDQ